MEHVPLREWPLTKETRNGADQKFVVNEVNGAYAPGKPILIPAKDLWIAALAREHVIPLLSRSQHFESVPGLKRIGWQATTRPGCARPRHTPPAIPAGHLPR